MRGLIHPLLLRTTLGKCRSVSGAALTLDKRLKSAIIAVRAAASPVTPRAIPQAHAS